MQRVVGALVVAVMSVAACSGLERGAVKDVGGAPETRDGGAESDAPFVAETRGEETAPTCLGEPPCCVDGRPAEGACDDGDPCTVGDQCGGGVCAGGDPADCDDGKACTEDGCDPATGCTHVAPGCDDEDACTDDGCDDGSGCTHTATDCEDEDACTVDACVPATGCTHTALACDDEDPCTDDGCDSATSCTHPALDLDDADACTEDACDPATGPTHTPLDCDDDKACTEDACDPATGCTNVAPGCDDGDACTDDGCDDGSGCTHTATECEDGDACTVDACVPATGCTHTALACDDADPCTDDGCDSATGCTHPALDLDDADACTEDACDPATGPTHTPMDCADDKACTVDGCDPATGCTNVAPGCDDGDACTVDGCVDGSGCTHPALDLDDGDACTEDACDPATGPTHTPLDCDDADPCTDDRCDSATGCTHPALDLDDADACTEDACDPATGPTHTPRDCDDADPCTDDGCDSATGCTHVSPECDDEDACTVDACDPRTGGCNHTPVEDPGDGEACNGVETCDPVTGIVDPPDEVDGTACDVAEVCAEWVCLAGACERRETDGSCDDNDACTGEGVCVEGVCASGAALEVPDKNPCNGVETCDPEAGIQAGTPLDCPDAFACTFDWCEEYVGCRHDADHSLCPAAPTCRDRVCDPTSGCGTVALEDGAPCADEDLCDGEERCIDGTCVAGDRLECNDGVACTFDTCDPATGCVHTPDDAACLAATRACTEAYCDLALGCQERDAADGTPCAEGATCLTGAATCLAGQCQGDLAVGACLIDGVCLDDGDPVPGEPCLVCNLAQPYEATAQTNGTACDDGLACTTDDVCAGGECEGTRQGRVCVIDGACWADDALDPSSHGCRRCDLGDPDAWNHWTFEMGGCDDGDACTVDTTCHGGECVGPPLACDDGVECTDDWCDPVTGCQTANDDDNACTESDGNPCTVPVCDDGVCASVPGPDGASCDDEGEAVAGHECTQDVCMAGACTHPVATGWCRIDGVCVPQGAAPAAGDDRECRVCAPERTQDAWTWFHEGEDCTTGRFEDGIRERCAEGVCRNAGPDESHCLIDGVVVAVGAVPAAGEDAECRRCLPSADRFDWSPRREGSACGAACFTNAKCTARECVGSTPTADPSAGDAGACEERVCDFATGWHTVPRPDGTACDDGVACTYDDACQAGVCEGTPYSCAPGGCLEASEACDGAGGCLGATITGGQCFVDGACRGAGDRNASQCGKCLPATSQTTWSPSGIAVENCDGNACMLGDACSGGECVPGRTPMACDDGNPCTDDRCVGGACEFLPNDRNPCSLVAPRECNVAACRDGECVATPANEDAACADDGLTCTHDVCAAGVCVHALDASACLVAGDCYASGPAPDSPLLPDHECLECAPGNDPFGFVAARDGEDCTDGDGLACTGGACAGGRCVGEIPRGDHCVIGGQCYAAGESPPASAEVVDADCLVCRPTGSGGAFGWTPTGENEPCYSNVCQVPGTPTRCTANGVCTGDAPRDGYECATSEAGFPRGLCSGGRCWRAPDCGHFVSPPTAPEVEVEFCRIVPPGLSVSFFQGCNEEANGRWDCQLSDFDEPQHRVTIRYPFSLMTAEATKEQFAAFLTSRGGPFCGGGEGWECATDPDIAWVDGRAEVTPGRASHPAVMVSIRAAGEFCEWLGGRLPTESEWELGARGPGTGQASDEAAVFAWGTGEIDGTLANYEGSGDPWESDETLDESNRTTPVCFFTGREWTREEGGWAGGPRTFRTSDGRSPYGLCEIAGNALEPCEDWFCVGYACRGSYNHDCPPDDGTVWDTCPASNGKVFRGGFGSENGPAALRSAARMGTGALWTCLGSVCNHAPGMGVRCAFDGP